MLRVSSSLVFVFQSLGVRGSGFAVFHSFAAFRRADSVWVHSGGTGCSQEIRGVCVVVLAVDVVPGS